MIRRFLAFLTILFFLTFIQPGRSEAFVPAIIPAAAVGATLLTVGAMAYFHPTSLPSPWVTPSMITSTGTNIVAIAVGAQLAANQYGQNVLYGDYCALKVSIANLQALFSDPAMDAAYPSLASVVMTPDSFPPVTINSQPGQNASFRGQSVIIDSNRFVLSYNDNPCAPEGVVCNSGATQTCFDTGGTSGRCNGYVVTFHSCTPPSPMPTPPAAIAAANPTGAMSAAATDDLDKLIAANANGFTVSIIDSAVPSNGDTALPLVPPAPTTSPLNPSAPVVQTGSTAAAATAASAATTASATAAAAQSAAANYLLSHPGATVDNDPAYAALINASVNAQVAAGTSTAIANSAAVQAQDTFPNVTNDSLLAIDFSPFMAISGAFSAVWPFCLLSSLSGMIQPLVAAPVAPSFVLPLPLGTHVTIDLSIFDQVAEVLRWAIGLCLTVGAIMGMARFWRGVS